MESVWLRCLERVPVQRHAAEESARAVEMMITTVMYT